MADYRAVFAVGESLSVFLQRAYDEANLGFPCKFKLLSSQEMTREDTDHDAAVSLYLHRITSDEHFRAATTLQDNSSRQPVLFLDLYYLITYWGTSAQAEQTILTWTMQELQSHSTLDSSVLSPDAGWEKTETISLTPVDLTLEDILRIWESLGPKYRLSLSYLARVVRIDRPVVPGVPVVATSHGYSGVAS